MISKWVHGIDNEAIVIQPNDATERVFELIEKSAEKDITIIAGNEVGDLFFEVLSRFSNGRGRTQECSVDVLLHRDYRNLHVYQTVHGSVDILKGKQEVNPTATLHALARILEKHAGVHNAVNSLFDAVCNLQDRGIKTADFGGNVSTMEFARRVINEWQIEP
ncbi:MAG: hypothetical protein D6732_02920 [Methanobacteriota archaeon]|nr:MAG: hypothetical protein D6732_02920 [Euryarchaeota archaeon]